MFKCSIQHYRFILTVHVRVFICVHVMLMGKMFYLLLPADKVHTYGALEDLNMLKINVISFCLKGNASSPYHPHIQQYVWSSPAKAFLLGTSCNAQLLARLWATH